MIDLWVLPVTFRVSSQPDFSGIGSPKESMSRQSEAGPTHSERTNTSCDCSDVHHDQELTLQSVHDRLVLNQMKRGLSNNSRHNHLDAPPEAYKVVPILILSLSTFTL